MPDNYSSDPPTPRFKLAALSIVGAAMVALPLAQVLRYQDTELQAALAEQAGLEPVKRAVAVQQGLLAHRDVAGQVLRGQVALESERRTRQRKVDERVAVLASALVVATDRTREEFNALRDDWALLARDVQQRTVSAPASDLAHRLLVEQTLQVIDFIADASGLGRGSDDGAALLASVMTHSLPRLAGEIAALAKEGASTEGSVDERQLAAVEAALARSLGRLNEAVAQSREPLPALAIATAEAGAAADRYFGLLREGAADAAPAGAAALRAHYRLLETTHALMASALSDRVDSTRREREMLLALTAVLALLAVALVGRIALPLRARRPAADASAHRDVAGSTPETAAAAGTHGAPTSGDEAGRLLRRLRRAADRAQRRGGEVAHTLPPSED